MNAHVRLFAAARAAAGKDSIELDLPANATIGQLRQSLQEAVPKAADVIARAMFAVDQEYAADSAAVPPNADVACIPPVSGG